MLDLKLCDIVDPPYPNNQSSDSSDFEEDVKSPKNLLQAEQIFYLSMANNEKYANVKHPTQFYAKYRQSLKHNCVMAKLIKELLLQSVPQACDVCRRA